MSVGLADTYVLPFALRSPAALRTNISPKEAQQKREYLRALLVEYLRALLVEYLRRSIIGECPQRGIV
jgi:hypothetical protein